ncbi:MAG: DUF748 domain-containing protein [Bacteroidia bacterium]
MHKLKKALLIFIGTLVITVVVVILFVSPIAKYLIEKYDEKYTGRQISLDRAYVNPFMGYVHLSNLKIYELKSDSVFFSANGVSASISLFKLFSKTYEISTITLDQPHGTVIQNKKDLNFNDLIERFSLKDSSATSKASVHFNILNIKINDGVFYYHELITPINYFIKNVNIESSGKHWDEDTIVVKFACLPGIGSGDAKGDFAVNVKTLNYRSAIVIRKLDLTILAQYLKELINYGSFSANMDMDMKATGNLSDEQNVTAVGMVAINDFHFGKKPGDDYASFDRLVMDIKEMSPRKFIYIYDSLTITHPYLKYELYDHLDNLQTMFGKNESKVKVVKDDPTKFNLVVEIARYVNDLAKNFFESRYKINHFAVYKANLQFNDYSESEKFSVNLNPLYIVADSINNIHTREKISFNSGIKPYGNAAAVISVNIKDFSDFDIQYNFQKIPASLFNPYLITQTSFPLDRGTLELNGKWNVKNGIIQSNNHLVVLDPRLSKRIRNKGAKWIPMRLIMTLTRNFGNVIDYEIPISGNLKNPKFHLCEVILDIVKNIFIKPITTPYRMDVKSTENEIEKSVTVKWQMRNNLLVNKQKKFLKKTAIFLAENPKASITVYPQNYAVKEKEYILFFEAKKKYYLMMNKKSNSSFTKSDSEKVDKMSVKDSLFVCYLNKLIKDPTIFTIQDKCIGYVGSAIVNSKYNLLNKERVNAFMFYFREMNVGKKIKIATAQDLVPYDGFSFYKIDYKGNFPDGLIKAYRKMNELNEEKPRKQFEKERNKNKNALL